MTSRFAHRAYGYHGDGDTFEPLPSGIFFNTSQLGQPDLASVYEKGINGLYSSVEHDHQISVGLVENGFHRASRAHWDVRAHSTDADSSGKDMRWLPILDVNIEVDMESVIAKTRVTQTFTNLSKFVIKDAKYSFPLYNESAVIGFRCHIGEDRLLEGVVKPKDLAKAEFKEAVAKQQVATLLEEHTPEIFETHLGNIPSKTTVKVEITYVTELKTDTGGEALLLTIPTSVAPRYGTPAKEMSTNLGATGNGLKITVNVSNTVAIRKLESRTHPISVEMGTAGPPSAVPTFEDLASPRETATFDPNKARAILSEHTVTLEKDFVLVVFAAGSSMLHSRALLEPAAGSDSQAAMMLNLNPRMLFSAHIEPETFQGEVIFIADRSESMRGPKINELRRALQIFLKSIPSAKVFFNIYSFGSTHSTLWPMSRQYTQKNLDEASAHVDTFTANMGGTEILSPIKEAVDRRINGPSGSSTQIIVLTDGEVWSTERTTDFVRDTRIKLGDQIRFFALGIGDQVSHRLVEGIGKLGGGFTEIVAVDSRSRWEDRVIRMLKGALTPPSFNCVIEFGGKESTAMCSSAEDAEFMQAPVFIPPLHPFSRFSIFFLFDSRFCTELDSITIKTTTLSGAQVAVSVPIERIDNSAFTVHYLAAKAIILDLESGTSWLHADAGNIAGREYGERLSIDYHVASKWTSFVAVEKATKVETNSRLYRALRGEHALLAKTRTVPVVWADTEDYNSMLVSEAKADGVWDADAVESPQRLAGPTAILAGLSIRRSKSKSYCSLNADAVQSPQCLVKSAASFADLRNSQSMLMSEAEEHRIRTNKTLKEATRPKSGKQIYSAMTGSLSKNPLSSSSASGEKKKRMFWMFWKRGKSTHDETKMAKESGELIKPKDVASGSGLEHVCPSSLGDLTEEVPYNNKSQDSQNKKNDSDNPERPAVAHVPTSGRQKGVLEDEENKEMRNSSPKTLPEQQRAANLKASVTLDDIIACQASSGIFAPTAAQMKEISHLFSLQFHNDVAFLLEAHKVQIANMDKLYSTLAIVVYVKSHFAEDGELWELVIRKAERWVATVIIDTQLREKVWKLAQNASSIGSHGKR